MKRFIPNRKCVCFCLLYVVFSVVTAFGQTKSESPDEIPLWGRFGGRSSAAYYDQKAEEAYEKRNAEIIPWAEDGTPPKQGNAALLYYQAFLLRPDPNEDIKYKIYPGTELNKRIRTYLGHCLPVIEIAEIASRMPQCIWGVWPERQLSLVALRRELGHLQDILLVDARALAADGHYRVAMERCLTVRRIARHLSEDSELYIYSIGSDQQALITVRRVLGVMPPDADILTWFRGQFSVVQGAPPSFAKSLQEFVKDELNHIRTHPARLARLRNLLVEGAQDERPKENARNLTDEQFLSRAGQGLQCFIDPILQTLDSEMTYEQKRTQMQRLFNKLNEEDGTDPVTKDIISVANMGGLIEQRYPYYVGHQAHINGVKAAMEVYLVVSNTGQLPEKLPEHLPKDPFTSRDFVYEITDEGSSLRCQGEEFLKRKKELLEFKVKKQS